LGHPDPVRFRPIAIRAYIERCRTVLENGEDKELGDG
jgi:hypothetical protein